jgi:NAD+ synthase
MVFVKKVNTDVKRIIGEFLGVNIRESGASGVVIGLSGGIDSALCAKLCVDTLGRERVHLFFMPEDSTPPGDFEDVEKLSRYLDVPVHTLPINDLVKGFADPLSRHGILGEVGEAAKNRGKINIKPRIRICILFYFANLYDCLVIGPSNKSELLVGYFTKFGDGASDLALIGDLYKTQVFQLARSIGMPQWLLEKKPSPGLAVGVNDEDELKITYAFLDQILAGFDLGYGEEYVAEKVGIPHEEVLRIRNMVISTIHKRRFPRIPKIGLYTVGIDRREY